jgi:hypothetical protein
MGNVSLRDAKKKSSSSYTRCKVINKWFHTWASRWNGGKEEREEEI